MASRRKKKKQNNLKADVVTQNSDNLSPSGQNRIMNKIKKVGDLLLNLNVLFTVSWTILLVIIPIIIYNTKKSLLSGYFNFFNISLNHIDIDSNKINFIFMFYYIIFILIIYTCIHSIKKIPNKMLRLLTNVAFPFLISLYLIYLLVLSDLKMIQIFYLIQDPLFLRILLNIYLFVSGLLSLIYILINYLEKKQKTPTTSKRFSLTKLPLIIKFTLAFIIIFIYIILINNFFTAVGELTARYQTKYEVLTITDANSDVKNEYIIAAYKGEMAIVIDCEVIQTTPEEEPTIDIYRSKGYQLINISNLPVRQITLKKYNIEFK